MSLIGKVAKTAVRGVGSLFHGGGGKPKIQGVGMMMRPGVGPSSMPGQALAPPPDPNAPPAPTGVLGGPPMGQAMMMRPQVMQPGQNAILQQLLAARR